MEPNKLMGAILFGVLLCVITFSPSTEGCSCMPQHPQTKYCNADYVILAQILPDGMTSTSDSNTYKIEIKETHKMSDKGKDYLKENTLSTPSSDAECGVTLETGKIYVIAGHGRSITICHYVKIFKEMTNIERRGVAELYKKGCACEVNTCYSNNPEDCPEAENSCSLKLNAKCETNFSACVPEDGSPRCHWKKTEAYKKCISES